MPWASNADLPARLKKHKTAHQQTVFRKTFADALREYNNEETAYKVAQAAARKAGKGHNK